MDELRPWLPDGAEDILGQDRQIIAMMRALELLPPGGVVGVEGPAGGGRELFLRRAAWLLAEGRQRLKLRNATALFPLPIWYEPHIISPSAHPLAGLVNAAMRSSSGTQTGANHGTEVINKLNRLDDANSPSGMRPAALPAFARISAGLTQVFNTLRSARPGRMVIFVSGLEQDTPARRWALLEGLALLRRAEVPVNVVVSLDTDSAREAARSFEPAASDERLDALVAERLDLRLVAGGLGVRRISTLLRRYLVDAEPLLRSSFGADSLSRLSLSAAHEPLGSPLFLRQLASRVVMLAEFVQELRAMQDLSEAQWAWIIISQRWPDLRGYTSTTARWAELRQTLQWLQKNDRDSRDMIRSPLVQRLEGDPHLFRYLRQHAEGFRSDADGLLRAEALLKDAGL